MARGARPRILCRTIREGEGFVPPQSYDAIVVGSGISGGWAAKELTEKGLQVLLLERGKNIEHVKDYLNATKGPW
ncbi:MAG TPA: NAD(P)-binding protein, partial [Gemmatimonadales bacterium]|nr:NAD(P)-binding protein [Gemmatimonadales bacterium]